ncbi:MAG TPA: MDR family MFS transporter [Candidatus Elarobacter sp.]|nr:MDR family MFS transporter [Candidatus Elarobacter sp.]
MTASAVPDRGTLLTIVAGVLLLVFMGALDQSIVTPALPAIARDFGSVAGLSWIVTAYLLVSTVLTLVYGKLSDVYGRRRLMLVAIAAFVAASLACALSRGAAQLVAARAVQGAGAGGLLVTSQAALADLVSPRERARYQLYITSSFALASASGPPLGGFLVEHLSWRWVFWVNVPIGAAAYAVCRRIPALRSAASGEPVDVLGLTLLALAVTLICFAAALGGTALPWLSLPMTAVLAGAAALLAAFLARELRASAPIFPPRLAANRTLRHGDAAVFLMGTLQLGALVLVLVFLQWVGGLGPGRAGALVVPLLIGMASASALSSQIMRRTGRYKALLLSGIAVTTGAYALLASMTAATAQPFVLGALFVLGLGIGSFMPTIGVAVQNAADPRDLGVAISTVVFARSLGGAFGAAIFWSLLLTFFARHAGAPDVAARFAALLERGGRAGTLPPDAVRTVVPALAHAFHDVFLIGSAVGALALLAIVRIPEEPLKTTRPSERAEGG